MVPPGVHKLNKQTLDFAYVVTGDYSGVWIQLTDLTVLVSCADTIMMMTND